MNKNLFLLLVVSLFLASSAFASKHSIKIITSNKPLAYIVAMVAHDIADIDAIITTNTCPHHYHLKPSSIKTIQSADLLVYIDDKFDNFVPNLLKNISHKAVVIKVSDLVLPNIAYYTEGVPNWHIWLDLDNTKTVMNEITRTIAQNYPELKESLYKNLEESTPRLNALQKERDNLLGSLSNLYITSDSLEYLLLKYNKELKKYYQREGQNSLKYASNLATELNKTEAHKCLVISTEQDLKTYQKLVKNTPSTIVQLDAEYGNASIGKTGFVDYYKGLLEQLGRCSK